jgi:hypothetical protein
MGTEKGVFGEMVAGGEQVDRSAKYIWEAMINGAKLEEMFVPLTGVDMLLKHDDTQPMLAFVGTENCGLKIKIVCLLLRICVADICIIDICATN